MPYSEKDRTDAQLSLYASTKNQLKIFRMLFLFMKVPITMMRFLLFMVHGVDQIWPCIHLPTKL